MSKITNNKSEPSCAFLGISIGSPYYSRQRIDDYLAWADLKLDHFAFLIGDDIFALTNSVFKKLSLKEAKLAASKKGDNFECMLNKAIKDRISTGQCKSAQNTKIYRWRDLSKKDEYNQYLQAALMDYKTSDKFRQSLREQIWCNLGSRLSVTGISRDFRKVYQTSIRFDNYLLREIAGLITISEHTIYNTEIYPGDDLFIMENVYASEYDHLASILPENKKRSFMKLQLD